jgi:dUTPase
LIEELSDCLHFIVELSLATGVTQGELFTGVENCVPEPMEGKDNLGVIFEESSGEFRDDQDFLSLRIYRTIDILGQTMHTLRQRPWRKENRVSDRKLFVAGLSTTFRSFLNVVAWGYDAEQLYHAYLDKSKINYERQQVGHGG